MLSWQGPPGGGSHGRRASRLLPQKIQLAVSARPRKQTGVPEAVFPPGQPCLGPAPLVGPGFPPAYSHHTCLEALSWHTFEPKEIIFFAMHPTLQPLLSRNFNLCQVTVVTPRQCPEADGHSWCSALLEMLEHKFTIHIHGLHECTAIKCKSCEL